MKASLKWLKDYVDVTLPPTEVARRLTLAGIGVENIETIGGEWEGIVIARLTAVSPHPNADRLRLATVDFGTGQETVVCGAPNLTVGDKIAFARTGCKLKDGHTGEALVLKPTKIRGVLSGGMVCSEKELGISENHEGILVLPPDAPIGAPLQNYLGDAILDFEITPNRPDCLCVTGIARELAVITRQGMRLPPSEYVEKGTPIEEQVSIEIVASDLCPRYCASLIKGIKVAPSPKWMQDRLIASGMRPINNIVDITNYVMLEYGEPLHAFDFSQIRGNKIIVRRANAGEKIISLDGQERLLTTDMLVIADAERAVAIAGVMGGAASEVIDSTTTILLEAANFKPASIRSTSQTLRLPSEASYRFERGLSAEITVPALKRATQLIVELGGGEAANGIVDAYPGKKERKQIPLSTAEVKRVLGMDFTLDEISGVLTSLGFDVKVTSPSELMATAPFWRSDINLKVDLIEEVARITGYDKMPVTLLAQAVPRQDSDPVVALKRKVREAMTALGFQETVGYSLTSLEVLAKLAPESHSVKPPPVKLANPLSVEQEYLHPTLRANLIAALGVNWRNEAGSIRLYELGRVFLPRAAGELPDEPESLCAILSGPWQEHWWQGDGDPAGFFDAKGVVEAFFAHLGIPVDFGESSDEGFHPMKQAVILVNGKKVGVVGEVHPKVLEAFDIGTGAAMFELTNLADLLPYTTAGKTYQPLWRFPATTRDIAILVDAGVTNKKVIDIIKGFSLVRSVSIFDVYSGEKIPAGKKSLAYRITYQTPSHTLTDKEVDGVQSQILNRLTAELGATLRG